MGASPVKAVDHGTPREAARDAGPSQGHGAGCLAQVVAHGSDPVHVAAAGAQAARQAPHAALPYAGVVTRLRHRRAIYRNREGSSAMEAALSCFWNVTMKAVSEIMLRRRIYKTHGHKKGELCKKKKIPKNQK